MIGTSEAMNLGQNLGLDPKLLADVINKSTGRCWSSEIYNPCPGVLENAPSSNNYQGGFGTALMAKVIVMISVHLITLMYVGISNDLNCLYETSCSTSKTF